MKNTSLISAALLGPLCCLAGAGSPLPVGPVAVYQFVDKTATTVHRDAVAATEDSPAVAPKVEKTNKALNRYLIRDLTSRAQIVVLFGLVDGVKTYAVNGNDATVSGLGNLNEIPRYQYGLPASEGSGYHDDFDGYWELAYPGKPGLNLRMQYEHSGSVESIKAKGFIKTTRLSKSRVSLTAATSLFGDYTRDYVTRDEDYDPVGPWYHLRTNGNVRFRLQTSLSDKANLAGDVTVAGNTYSGGTLARGLYEVVQQLTASRYVEGPIQGHYDGSEEE
jgi:hypothetical protein